MISYKLVSHCKPLWPIISKLWALLGLAILVWPLRSPRSNLTKPKDSQPMISYRLVYHPKPLGPIIRHKKYKHFSWLTKNAHGDHLVFQNEAENISSHDFVMRNISWEFEISTYNTLCSRQPTKVLALSRINVPGSHLVFQNEAKIFPAKILWLWIYPANLRRLAIIFLVRVATANNKGGIWPHSLRYHFESFLPA